jgi:glycine oxidase
VEHPDDATYHHYAAVVAKGLGLDLPVKPVRGQIIWYQAPEAGIRHVLIRNMKYVVPRQEGVVLVGSTLEDVGFDDRPTPEARAMLEEMAAQIVPLLGRLPVQGHWAGLRPGSPGGIPFTGAVPGIPGLWLNTGHHCYGLKLAPGSAALLAALMTGAEPPIDPAPFDPGARMAL